MPFFPLCRVTKPVFVAFRRARRFLALTRFIVLPGACCRSFVLISNGTLSSAYQGAAIRLLLRRSKFSYQVLHCFEWKFFSIVPLVWLGLFPVAKIADAQRDPGAAYQELR